MGERVARFVEALDYIAATRGEEEAERALAEVARKLRPTLEKSGLLIFSVAPRRGNQ